MKQIICLFSIQIIGLLSLMTSYAQSIEVSLSKVIFTDGEVLIKGYFLNHSSENFDISLPFEVNETTNFECTRLLSHNDTLILTYDIDVKMTYSKSFPSDTINCFRTYCVYKTKLKKRKKMFYLVLFGDQCSYNVLGIPVVIKDALKEEMFYINLREQ